MSAKFNRRIFFLYLLVSFFILHYMFKSLHPAVVLLIAFVISTFLLIGIDAIILHLKDKKQKKDQNKEKA